MSRIEHVMNTFNDVKKESNENTYLILFIVTLALFIIKVFWALPPTGPTVFLDEVLYRESASALISLSKYSSPQYPPLYPLLISPALLLENWYQGMIVLNAFWSSLLVPATWFLSRSVRLKNPLFPAFLVALLPMHVIYPSLIMSENLFVTIFVLAVALTLHDGKTRLSRSLAFGFSLGLANITKYLFLPSVIILFFVYLAQILWFKRRGKNLGAAGLLYNALVVCFGYALPMSAWIVYSHFSAITPSRALGFLPAGQFASDFSLDSAVMWAVVYGAYAVLAWTPFLLIILLWATSSSHTLNLFTRMPHQSRFFTVIVVVLTASHLLLAAHHSLGQGYNNPTPQYVIGRYLMHLTPLLIVMSMLGIEQLRQAKKPQSWPVGLVILSLVILLAVFSWSVLFDQGIWELPWWFSTIRFQSVGIGELKSPLLFGITMTLLVITSCLISWGLKLPTGYHALSVAAFLIILSLANVLQMTKKRGSSHVNEISPTISVLLSQNKKIAVVVNDLSIPTENLKNALRFYFFKDDRVEVIGGGDVEAEQRAMNLPALVVSRTNLELPLVRKYQINEKNYLLYLRDLAARPER